MGKHQEWLDRLSEGDQVAIQTVRYGNNIYELAAIKRITPKRTFQMQDGTIFPSKGIRKVDNMKEGDKYLTPITEAILDFLRQENFRDELKNSLRFQ